MALLGFLFEKRASFSQTNPRDPVLAEWFGGAGNTAAGINVTPDKAMQVIAVYAAIRIIAETEASLPLPLYKHRADGGKEKAINHPLYSVLHDQPNNWQTAMEFREMITGHAALRGNGYAEIIGGMSFVDQLIPLHPDRVLPFQAPDRTIAYEYSPLDGPKRIILQSEMFHIRGLSQDGIKGVSPIALAAEGIGLSLAAEEFGGTFFGNGTTPGGVLEHPEALGDKAYERLKKSWVARHQGAGQAHKPAILEEGMKWHALGLAPEEAQFLETRKFQITEIARLFRVPPHMLGDLEKATFSNIEQQSQDFVTHTLCPWLVRWEQAIRRDLLSKKDQKKYFAKHNVDGLLRGDSAARSAFYTSMFTIGAYSVNQILEKEDENPVKDGDKRFVPMNMTTLEKAGETDEADQLGAAQDEINSLRTQQDGRLASVLSSSAGRIARMEQNATRNAMKSKGPGDDFTNWAQSFFDDDHAELIARSMGIDQNVANIYVLQAKNSLLSAVNARSAELLDQWDATRSIAIMQLPTDLAEMRVEESPHVTVQAPITHVDVHNDVEAPNVTVENNLPELHIDNNVDVTTPDVTVENRVDAPVVTVTVEAPSVSVTNEVVPASVTIENIVETPKVEVILPNRKRKVDFQRNKKGDIIGADIKGG